MTILEDVQWACQGWWGWFSALAIQFLVDIAVFTEEFLKSDLNIEVDTTELALYLAIMIDKDELQKLGLSDVVHKRISTGGRKTGITTEEISNRGNKTKSLFHGPARAPTRDETRLMLSLALTLLIKAYCSN